jgi:hypothetical protein
MNSRTLLVVTMCNHILDMQGNIFFHGFGNYSIGLFSFDLACTHESNSFFQRMMFAGALKHHQKE